MATLATTIRTAPPADSNAGPIPPDLAAVLHDAPIHPALAFYRSSPMAAQPSAAALVQAALSIAATAAVDSFGADLMKALHLPPGTIGLIHRIGPGGVLHLGARDAPRTVSLAHGTLEQRGSAKPRLRPGAVRLMPPGHCVTLADLTGGGALAVEVAATGAWRSGAMTGQAKLDAWKSAR
jgi:hypothetical protein